MHVLTISITTSIRIYVGHTKSNEQQFFYKFSVYIFPLFWKFEYSLAVVFCSSCPKTLTHSCLECHVRLVMLTSHLILHKIKKMVIRGCQIRTVRSMRENFPPHVLNFFQGQNSSVRLSVIVLQDDLSSDNLSFQSSPELHCALFQVLLQLRPASHVCLP